jgi:hypothetical protein
VNSHFPNQSAPETSPDGGKLKPLGASFGIRPSALGAPPVGSGEIPQWLVERIAFTFGRDGGPEPDSRIRSGATTTDFLCDNPSHKSDRSNGRNHDASGKCGGPIVQLDDVSARRYSGLEHDPGKRL